MTETLWGVLIGGGLGLIGSFIVQRYETKRHTDRLAAERTQRREDFWHDRMTGPFLDHRRAALQRVIELLSYDDFTLIAEEEFKSLEPFAPGEVLIALREWYAEREKARRLHEEPEGVSVQGLRYAAVGIANRCLRESMAPEAKREFVEFGKLPVFE